MRIGSVRRVTAISAVVVLTIAGGTGAMLTRIYVPSPAGSSGFMSEQARWSGQVSDVHEQLLLLSGLLLVVLVGVSFLALRRAEASRTDLWTAVGALLSICLASLAWTRVQFDQVGLWAVTVADDLRGLWFAAFSDQVRFVFIDGREAAPSEIAPWVVVHLVTPFVAVALLVLGWMRSRPSRPPRRVVASEPQSERPDPAQ